MPRFSPFPGPMLLIAVTIVAGVVSVERSALAQARKQSAPAQRAPQNSTAPAAGEPAEPALPRITPQEQAKVDQLLRRWEAHTGDIKTLRGQFGRITDNVIFKTKTKDTGAFIYKAPDKGKFWVDREGDPEKWICDGKAVLQFNDETRQVKRIELPPDLQGEHIRKGPMPFLFGMSADELRRRYWLKITKETPGEIWLEAYPLQREDAANFRVAQLILNTESYLPRAIKLHDPNGKDSRVYTLHNLKANVLVLDTEFHPPLFGWKVVTIPADDPGVARPLPRVSASDSKTAGRVRRDPSGARK